MVSLFIGIKLCTTLKSSDLFFFGGNFVQAPQRLLRWIIIPASSMAKKIVLAKSRSFVGYLDDFFFIGHVFDVRSIECSIRLVTLTS